MKIKPIVILVAVAIAFAVSGATLGYVYTINKYKEEIPITIRQQESFSEKENESVSLQQEKITPSTKIVYRYCYTEDGTVEEREEVPPYFLLDLTLSDMLKYYTTWEIVSFSAKEVVMQKTIIGPGNQRYVIGEKEGYVAVFYEEEQQGISLKEVTEIPIDGLSEEEKLRLSEGIKVIGKDALARTLENYSS